MMYRKRSGSGIYFELTYISVVLMIVVLSVDFKCYKDVSFAHSY